ncbi:unnamed protein product [Aphanomyces euteiches]
MGCNWSMCSKPSAPSEEKDSRSSSTDISQVPVVQPVAIDRPLHFRDKYILGGALGEGSYASVKKARNKETGTMYAVKVFKKANLSPDDEKDIHSEVEILSRLKHPNVLNLIDFYSELKHYYIVTDLCEGGELFDRIAHLTYYTEKEARDLVKTLLTGIKYCHDLGIVHRDLKPENILMTDKENNSSIKIADFGFAKEVTNGLTTTCGSPEYIAPEIIARSNSEEKYGTHADIWSIGVITYVLLAGYTPFHDDNQSVLFDNIANGLYYFYSPDWDEVSQEAKDFVSWALTLDPKQRPSADDLLKDTWITQENVSVYQLSGVMEKLPMLNKRKFKAAVQATILINKLRNKSQGEDESISV